MYSIFGRHPAGTLSFCKTEMMVVFLQSFRGRRYVYRVFLSKTRMAYLIPPGATVLPYVMSIWAISKKCFGLGTRFLLCLFLVIVVYSSCVGGTSHTLITLTVGFATCWNDFKFSGYVGGKGYNIHYV